MSRFIRTLGKHRLFAAGGILCCLFFLQQSCTKIDTRPIGIGGLSNLQITEKFFNVPANAPAAVKRVAEELRKENAVNEFIPQLVRDNGFPADN